MAPVGRLFLAPLLDSPGPCDGYMWPHLQRACRRLRLPTVRAVLSEALAVAGKEQLTYQGFLAELLLAECDDRDRRSSIRRVKAANFPPKYMARRLRFRRQPEHKPSNDPHSRDRRLDPQRRTPLPDRRLRNR
jgi:hypothetical protein